MSETIVNPVRDLVIYVGCVLLFYVVRIVSDAHVSAYVSTRLAECEADFVARETRGAMGRDGATDEAEGLAYRTARDMYAVAHAATCAAWSALTTGERTEMIAEGYDGARRLNTF